MNRVSNNYRLDNYRIVCLTLFVGLILQTFPWTSNIFQLKPNWLMIILIYWIIALPHQVGIKTAFIVGILFDLLSGTLLGVHSFIFSIIAYLVRFKFQIIRNLALWQQSLVIFILSTIYTFLLFLFEIIIYQITTLSPLTFLSAFLDSFLWIWVFLLLRQVKQNFSIS